jgi:hypothetical protein
MEGKLTIDSTKGHAGSSADKSGKALAVSSDEFAALSGVILLLVEIEDEILVIGEKVEAFSGTDISVRRIVLRGCC